jgi:hypothetical protein
MFDDVNRMGAKMTAQFRDGGNIVRSRMGGELSARMSCREIQGEFREFRGQFNELAEQFEQRSGALTNPVGA